MADCHQGYGMPIGGVIAAEGVIIPNSVGVDIGCGMCAVKTTLSDISNENIKKIMQLIRKKIPLGRNHHKEDKEWGGFDAVPDIPIINKEIKSAKRQLGTLGGGNHFIEIQKGSDGFIWIMIHSGSRNLGYKIANEYNKIAQDLCNKWHSNIPPLNGKDGLAFLPVDTEEGKEYIEAMNFALSFALENRKQMVEDCKESFLEVLECGFSEMINIHHNYAALENHYGKNVWIHRKGATSARKDQMGIIPGSQGTASYIVIGKGNHESFMSCSHGAGRKMSRTKAKNELNLEEEKKLLDDQNIVHSIRTKNDLEEATSAYKDIEEVMAAQDDLVDINVILKPLAVIKG